MGLRPQPFTTISIAVALIVAYLWVAATLGLPLGKLAFWLLAPTTWWGMTSFALLWVGWIALIPLTLRERTRIGQPKLTLEGRSASEKSALLVLGGVLITAGFVFGQETILPGFCNTPSGYCIDAVPSIRALISSLGNTIFATTGAMLIVKIILQSRRPANRKKPRTFLDLQPD